MALLNWPWVELGVCDLSEVEDCMYMDGHALKAEAEKFIIHRVGCRGRLGPSHKKAMYRQRKRADGNGRLRSRGWPK